MKKSELIVGGAVVAAAGVGAFLYLKNKKAQAAAIQAQNAEASQEQQAAYSQLQTSVLSYLQNTLANTSQTNTAPKSGMGMLLSKLQISQLQQAQQNYNPSTENVSPGSTEVAATATQQIGGANLEWSQLNKLIKTVQANLLSFDELNAVNNEILVEQNNYVGTMSTGDVQAAFNAVLKKYNIK